jgi:hypothetical protein
VGGGDKSAEAKPPRCLSVGSFGPVGRASPPSSSECCSARLWRAADRRTSGDWMDARCISLFQRPGWEPARVAFDAAQFPSTRFGGCQLESLEPNSRIHSRTADGLISGNGQFENHSPSKWRFWKIHPLLTAQTGKSIMRLHRHNPVDEKPGTGTRFLPLRGKTAETILAPIRLE